MHRATPGGAVPIDTAALPQTCTQVWPFYTRPSSRFIPPLMPNLETHWCPQNRSYILYCLYMLNLRVRQLWVLKELKSENTYEKLSTHTDCTQLNTHLDTPTWLRFALDPQDRTSNVAIPSSTLVSYVQVPEPLIDGLWWVQTHTLRCKVS